MNRPPIQVLSSLCKPTQEGKGRKAPTQTLTLTLTVIGEAPDANLSPSWQTFILCSPVLYMYYMYYM